MYKYVGVTNKNTDYSLIALAFHYTKSIPTVVTYMIMCIHVCIQIFYVPCSHLTSKRDSVAHNSKTNYFHPCLWYI